MAHIAIVTQDALLSEALSDIISTEMGEETTSVESIKSLDSLNKNKIDLVLSDQLLNKEWLEKLHALSLDKPLKIQDLLASIQKQLKSVLPVTMSLGAEVILHTKAKQLQHLKTGTSVDLTDKEQGLILFLKEHKSSSREEILKEVWGVAEGVTTRTLESHVYRLRQKWRELADNDCIIATDKGYRWHDDEC